MGDLEDCVRAKLVHDYSGHYNRPDVFTLTVNTAVPVYVETSQSTGPSNQTPEPGSQGATNGLPEQDPAQSQTASQMGPSAQP